MIDDIELLREEIANHETNRDMRDRGYAPLFVASSCSKIIIVGQAPGIRAQVSDAAWNDASGVRLVRWLGVSEEQFRDPGLFAHMPMDFYYPGRGRSGDLPPRKMFAPLWHGRLKELMPKAQLIILVGKYAQDYYLSKDKRRSLTDTVRSFQDYLPDYFPLVHPSPLNFRWHTKNDWFEKELIPVLQQTVADIIKPGN